MSLAARILFCVWLIPSSLHSSDCIITHRSSKHGERLTYKIYYTLAGAYVGAGEVVFDNHLEQYMQRPVWHVRGIGRTYESYDWFFKVRDSYESYIDTSSFLPLKFVRNVSEGGNKLYEQVQFDHQRMKAVSTQGVFPIKDCTYDVLSAIYYARNIDFSNRKVGDKIPLRLYLSDSMYSVYIRYLGKETIKTRFGQFQTIKFRPLLIEGTIFRGGEKMDVWVSDDDKRIPVMVNTPILVGNIRVLLSDMK